MSGFKRPRVALTNNEVSSFIGKSISIHEASASTSTSSTTTKPKPKKSPKPIKNDMPTNNDDPKFIATPEALTLLSTLHSEFVSKVVDVCLERKIEEVNYDDDDNDDNDDDDVVVKGKSKVFLGGKEVIEVLVDGVDVNNVNENNDDDGSCFSTSENIHKLSEVGFVKEISLTLQNITETENNNKKLAKSKCLKGGKDNKNEPITKLTKSAYKSLSFEQSEILRKEQDELFNSCVSEEGVGPSFLLAMKKDD